MTRPFDGITVFTLGHAVAAHFASWQLAHLGPRVIEVYRSGVGDFARNYDDRVDRPWSLEDLRVEFFEITDKVPTMDVGLACASDNEQ